MAAASPGGKPEFSPWPEALQVVVPVTLLGSVPTGLDPYCSIFPPRWPRRPPCCSLDPPQLWDLGLRSYLFWKGHVPSPLSLCQRGLPDHPSQNSHPRPTRGSPAPFPFTGDSISVTSPTYTHTHTHVHTDTQTRSNIHT